MSCTAAVLSKATLLDNIIEEIGGSDFSERGARMDDKRSEAAMEERKKVGYF
jgi:sulfate adenylyltransferase subunit 2